LLNCSYDIDDKKIFQARWADLLNQHGLFDNLENAAAFKEATDARMADHGPFFVFGLLRAPGII
jgi:hypothetical protein